MWCPNCSTYFNYDTGRKTGINSNPQAAAYNQYGVRTQIKDGHRMFTPDTIYALAPPHLRSIFRSLISFRESIHGRNHINELRVRLHDNQISSTDYQSSLMYEHERDVLSKVYAEIIDELMQQLVAGGEVTWNDLLGLIGRCNAVFPLKLPTE